MLAVIGVLVAPTHYSIAEGKTKKARSGWGCPNGNTFAECGHDCKYVHYKNGKIDLDHERGCARRIIEHTQATRKITKTFEASYQSCTKSETVPNADLSKILRQRTPCNFWFNFLMKDVHGIYDFMKQKDHDFMTAAQTYDFLRTSPKWTEINAGHAQAMANMGRPVAASTKGHIAMVIPGAATFSYRWDQWDPVITSLQLDDTDNALRCFPSCYASEVWRKRKSPPKYFVRGK